MNISNYYPAMNSDDCSKIGMSGKCGFDCPVYQDGKCENHAEIVDRITTISQLEKYESLYGQVNLATAITLNLVQ